LRPILSKWFAIFGQFGKNCCLLQEKRKFNANDSSSPLQCSQVIELILDISEATPCGDQCVEHGAAQGRAQKNYQDIQNDSPVPMYF
jgi:hypothetical protein